MRIWFHSLWILSLCFACRPVRPKSAAMGSGGGAQEPTTSPSSNSDRVALNLGDFVNVKGDFAVPPIPRDKLDSTLTKDPQKEDEWLLTPDGGKLGFQFRIKKNPIYLVLDITREDLPNAASYTGPRGELIINKSYSINSNASTDSRLSQGRFISDDSLGYNEFFQDYPIFYAKNNGIGAADIYLQFCVWGYLAKPEGEGFVCGPLKLLGRGEEPKKSLPLSVSSCLERNRGIEVDALNIAMNIIYMSKQEQRRLEISDEELEKLRKLEVQSPAEATRQLIGNLASYEAEFLATLILQQNNYIKQMIPVLVEWSKNNTQASSRNQDPALQLFLTSIGALGMGAMIGLGLSAGIIGADLIGSSVRLKAAKAKARETLPLTDQELRLVNYASENAARFEELKAKDLKAKAGQGEPLSDAESKLLSVEPNPETIKALKARVDAREALRTNPSDEVLDQILGEKPLGLNAKRENEAKVLANQWEEGRLSDKSLEKLNPETRAKYDSLHNEARLNDPSQGKKMLGVGVVLTALAPLLVAGGSVAIASQYGGLGLASGDDYSAKLRAQFDKFMTLSTPIKCEIPAN